MKTMCKTRVGRTSERDKICKKRWTSDAKKGKKDEIYSTPKETHYLYVFTIVKNFNRRYLCYLWIYCPEFLHATF